MTVALGDFNVQTKGWYPVGKRPYKNTRIDGSQFGLEQLIHEPTDINGDKPSLDLSFASQPNLVAESTEAATGGVL